MSRVNLHVLRSPFGGDERRSQEYRQANSPAIDAEPEDGSRAKQQARDPVGREVLPIGKEHCSCANERYEYARRFHESRVMIQGYDDVRRQGFRTPVNIRCLRPQALACPLA